MKHYAQRLKQLEVEAAALRHELEHSPEETQGLLKARLASVLRSAQWFRTRVNTRPSRPAGVGTSEIADG